MGAWILVAAVGGVFALVGLVGLFRRYLRGELSGRYVSAAATGLASLLACALASALRPDAVTGAVMIVLLLPGFVAVVALMREHERMKRGC